MPDLLKEGIKQLHISVWEFNQLLQRTGINNLSGANGEDVAVGANVDCLIKLDKEGNKEVNELFLTVQARLTLTSNLTNIYF